MLDAETPVKPDPDGLPDIQEVDEDPDEVIILPYSVNLCLDLWKAWEKGVMARAGGYLDQPIRWRRLIHTFNQRHNRVLEDKEADKQEQEYMRGLMGG